ncbi:MAG: hypothetical protein V1823_05355 [Chloroflexota bacterium]
MNRRVTIIYSPMTGNSKKMSEAGADVRLVCASDSTGADVENCDALVWGTGNYYAYMQGLLKDWLDSQTLNRDQSGKTKPPLTSRYPG